MIKCVIIDDFQGAIDVLETHIKSRIELELVGSFTNPLDALNFIYTNPVNLVFLDIEMNEINGLDFIDLLKENKRIDIPYFILTTGFPNYAVKSYEYDVLDYIMKPVTIKRFFISIDKYLNKRLGTNEINYDFFFIDSEGKKLRILYDEIVFIESAGNYVFLYKNSSRHLIYKSLQDMLDVLDSKKFIRIHKSYIVALRQIESYHLNEVFVKYKSEQFTIPIGRKYKDILKQLFI